MHKQNLKNNKLVQFHKWTIFILLSLFLIFNLIVSCNNSSSPDPTPTPTETATPTITPTYTPTGNAPELIYPIDNVTVTSDAITFDWTDSVGATQYWIAFWIKYPTDGTGQWITVWNELYQNSTESSLTLTKDDIWFYFGGDDYGWVASDYAWIVTSDTSTAWSEFGYFHWGE